MNIKFRDDKHKDLVVSRIKKLLAVADNNTFEEEASTAMKIAKQMMARYSLELSDVEMKAEASNIKEGLTERSGRIQFFEKLIARAVGILCDTESLIKHRHGVGSFLFIGMKEDVEMSLFMFQTLYSSIKRISLTKYQRNDLRHSYRMGIAKRLCDRAKHETKEAIVQVSSYGSLMVLKEQEIRKFMEDKHTDVRESKSKVPTINDEAFIHGYRDGATIDLGKQRKLEE